MLLQRTFVCVFCRNAPCLPRRIVHPVSWWLLRDPQCLRLRLYIALDCFQNGSVREDRKGSLGRRLWKRICPFHAYEIPTACLALLQTFRLTTEREKLCYVLRDGIQHVCRVKQTTNFLSRSHPSHQPNHYSVCIWAENYLSCSTRMLEYQQPPLSRFPYYTLHSLHRREFRLYHRTVMPLASSYIAAQLLHQSPVAPIGDCVGHLSPKMQALVSPFTLIFTAMDFAVFYLHGHKFAEWGAHDPCVACFSKLC